MTVGDGVVAIAHHYVVAVGVVTACGFNLTVKHGKGFFISRLEVYALVGGQMAGKGVFAITKRGIDMNAA